jgi:hypothetical protein
MPTVLIHILNDDPVLAEMENMPAAGDQMIIVKNPRRKDGKDLPYLEPNVSQVAWPLVRVNFIEIMPSGEEEDIITFIRE